MRPSKLDQEADRITHLLANEYSQRDIAKSLGVARSTLQNWIETRLGEDRTPVRDDDLTAEPTDEVAFPVIFREYDAAEHYVYPLGDVHVGSPQFDDAKWKEWLAYLAENKDTSMLGTGDYLNSALKTSVSDTYAETHTVQEAKWKVCDDLAPLAQDDRLDLLIPGNHEGRIHNATGDCPIYDIARSLEVPYSKTGAMVVYKIGDVEYEVFVRHGTGGGGVGARANRLAKQAQVIQADVYITAHTHSQLVFPEDILVRRGDRIVRKKMMFVSAGSFLAYEEYVAIMGLTPAHMGAPRIRLNGERHDVHVSV